jgi:hypothetical protein
LAIWGRPWGTGSSAKTVLLTTVPMGPRTLKVPLPPKPGIAARPVATVPCCCHPLAWPRLVGTILLLHPLHRTAPHRKCILRLGSQPWLGHGWSASPWASLQEAWLIAAPVTSLGWSPCRRPFALAPIDLCRLSSSTAAIMAHALSNSIDQDHHAMPLP